MTDAETFLAAWHGRHAGASGLVFGRGRTDDGRDSYDRLAEHAAGAARVLDVACGDGTLLARVARVAPEASRIGVDLSLAELAAARARDPDATWLEGRAQALPLPDAHVDVVLSHMALMLMDEVDAVVGELARVLRPGGRLAVVVGTGIGDRVREVLDGAWASEPTGELPPPLGDPRTRSAEGLGALLAPIGPTEVTPLALELEVPRAELGGWLSHAFYGTDGLDPEAVAASVASAPDPLPVTFHMLLATATRR